MLSPPTVPAQDVDKLAGAVSVAAAHLCAGEPMTHARSPLPIAVLISGSGTTLENLVRRTAAGELAVDVRLVISSSPQAPGLRHATAAGIQTLVVRREDHPQAATFSQAIFQPCRDVGARLVVMGGFIKLVPIPPDFENRVMNIHPGLIPAFCGRGYYGLRVHQAVLEYGAKLSGCTVHFVDDQYDHGPIILQRAVEVRDDDTPETLQRRVFQVECEAYPEAIRRYAEGRLRVIDRRVYYDR
jgi:phosphoribosylglycinamide formyltransferase-1